MFINEHVKCVKKKFLMSQTQCDKTQSNSKNCSSNCAYDCVQLNHTIQYNTIYAICN